MASTSQISRTDSGTAGATRAHPATAELEPALQTLAVSLDRSPLATIISAPSTGAILFANEAAATLVRRPQADLMASSMEDLAHPDFRAEHAGNSARSRDAADSATLRQYLRGDGTDVWAHLYSYQPEGFTDTSVHQLLAGDVVREIQASHKRAARTDGLTGLVRRDHALGLLEELLASDRSVGVVFLDFDNFASINETLGQAGGDRVLRWVAQRVTNAARNHDVVARLGGDEFLIVAPDIDSIALTGFVRRLDQKIRQPLSGTQMRVSASLGQVHLAPQEHCTVENAINRADADMHRQKRRRRKIS